MNMVTKFFLVFVVCFVSFTQAMAQTSEGDIEKRAQEIGSALRCVVCQNQSIDESNAPLASDMRIMVRDRLRAGDSNEQVIGFMRERYGDFVLLKPPMQANTYVLWFLPFACLFLLFVWYIWRAKNKRQQAPNIPLSEAEREQLSQLTNNRGERL